MSFLGGTVAFIYNAYNTVVASLATRTTERDAARNSLYVSGTYLSGESWQTAASDPGNHADSFTDLVARLWRVTAGLWHSSYTAMVTDRNTWQGRANLAWGASHVWNSGTSFEARVPPSAADTKPLSGNGVVTLDRTGTWYYFVSMNCRSGVVETLQVTSSRNGTTTNITGVATTYTGGPAPKLADFVGPLSFVAGDQMTIAASISNGSFTAVFVPTATNPN